MIILVVTFRTIMATGVLLGMARESGTGGTTRNGAMDAEVISGLSP